MENKPHALSAQETLLRALRAAFDGIKADRVYVGGLVASAILDLEAIQQLPGVEFAGHTPYRICEYRGKDVYVNPKLVFYNCELQDADGDCLGELDYVQVINAT